MTSIALLNHIDRFNLGLWLMTSKPISSIITDAKIIRPVRLANTNRFCPHSVHHGDQPVPHPFPRRSMPTLTWRCWLIVIA
jgi:hypothetical protein